MASLDGSLKNNEHIAKYMWRGFWYGLTSTCTILAGYFMQPQKTLANDLLLLFIPIFASVYFFIRYANRFHPDDSPTTPSDVGRFAQSEAVRVYFYLVLIPYTAFVIYYVSRTEALSYRLLFSLFLYVGLFIYYGRFLINYKSNGDLPLVRHWLVWPVTLSIAIGLYYGLSFSDLKVSLGPLFPVGLVILLYVASVKLPRKLYLWLTLLVILATTTVSFLNQIGYLSLPARINLPSLLFCVAAAAYLAVFEAWRITSDIAKAERDKGNNALRYAQATLTALTASVWLLPFYYIFSSYGSAFLIGFAIHAFAAFICWFYFGKDPYLQKWSWSNMWTWSNIRSWSNIWSWSNIKVGAGVLFLGLLVLSPTRLFSEQFPFHFLKGFVGWGIGLFGLVVFILISQLAKDFGTLRDEEAIETPFIELFKERINFTRALSLLCFVATIIIALRLQSIDESSPQYSKAELAFLIYAICILLCFVVEAREFFRRRPKVTQRAKSIVGVLLIIRVFTSLLIALVVFLPLLRAGMSIGRSVLSALPFFCAAAGGFAINDYYDVIKDSINKPYRAIPSGRMKPNVALLSGIALLGAAFLFSFLAYRSNFQLSLYLISIVGVATYNLFVKYVSLSKTFLTAAVSVLPVLYVVTSLSYPSEYVLVPIGSMIFLLGRELLMDIRDIKGDRASGIRTFPMLLGSELTAKLAFFLLMSCGAVLLFFTAKSWSVRNLSLSCFILLSSFILSLVWSYKAGKYRRSVIISLYLPMLCGILLLLR